MAIQLDLFNNYTEEEDLMWQITTLEKKIDKSRMGLFKRYTELEKNLKELKTMVNQQKGLPCSSEYPY